MVSGRVGSSLHPPGSLFPFSIQRGCNCHSVCEVPLGTHLYTPGPVTLYLCDSELHPTPWAGACASGWRLSHNTRQESEDSGATGSGARPRRGVEGDGGVWRGAEGVWRWDRLRVGGEAGRQVGMSLPRGGGRPRPGRWPQLGDRAQGTSQQGGCFGLSPHLVSHPEARRPQTLQVLSLRFDSQAQPRERASSPQQKPTPSSSAAK